MTVAPREQIISLHTIKGVQLYQFTPTDQATCTWTRTLRNVSSCDLATPPVGDPDRLPNITPWAHWISIWDADRNTLLWTGPIQKVTGNRNGLSISAGDHAALLTRTRVPITKRWDAADPAWIADELWQAMIAHHGLNIDTITRPDPEGDRFDYKVITDAQMLDQTISDLIQLGLRYTIVSGIPILGPMPLQPITTLSENDFLGDSLNLVRDGTATYNDILVRGPDNLARAHVDLQGLNLQTIANVDSMFGVSNVLRAAQQYARHTAAIRSTIDLPSGTQLHPDAPLSIDDLIPSTRIIIEAHGIRQLMELDSVEIATTSDSSTVKVTMESVNEKIELQDINKTGQAGVAGVSL